MTTIGTPANTGRIGRLLDTSGNASLEIGLASTAEIAAERRGRTLASISRECIRQHLALILPLTAVDLGILVTAFWLSCSVAGDLIGMPVTHQSTQVGALAAIAAFLYAGLGLYNNVSLQPVNEFRQIVIGSSLSVLILGIANAAFARLTVTEQWAFGATALIMLVLGPTTRAVARRFLGQFHWWLRPVVFVGSGAQAERVGKSLLQRPWLGFRPIGTVDDLPTHRNAKDQSLPYLGSIEELADVANRSKACWAMVAMAGRSPADVQRALETCSEIVPNVVVASNMHGVPALWNRTQECGDTTGIHFQASLLLLTPQWVKRTLDLVVITCGAVFVIPLVLAIAIAIRVVSPSGPVFFGHSRLGRGGAQIVTWKFRTMVPDAESKLERYLNAHPDQRHEWQIRRKLKKDPRVIPYIGSFLRKFSLDELPQLWNVLKGEMSLVGPRPIVAEEVEKYAGAFSLYQKVRPGITGLWQISGRNDTTYQERIDFDVYYVTNWSPWLDLYILVRTIRTVLLREGAY
jgi:Undecaprenyl-phosphate galactose phosphotransferase WbaP